MHIYVEFSTSNVLKKTKQNILSFSSVLIKKASVYNIGNNFSLKFQCCILNCVQSNEFMS